MFNLQQHEEYQRAVEFAAYWHQQSPQTEGICKPDIYYPYICHCIAVTNYVLWGINKDKIKNANFPILTLSLLHDVLEDTPVTQSELTETFTDPDLFSCLKAITCNQTLPSSQQLEDSLHRINQLPEKLRSITAMVKIADRIANIDIRVANRHLMTMDAQLKYIDESRFLLTAMGNCASPSFDTLLKDKIEVFVKANTDL